MKEAHLIPAQLSPYHHGISCVFTQVAFPYSPNSGCPECPFAWRTAKTRTLCPLLGRSAVSDWRAGSLPLKWKTTRLTVNPRLTESLAGVCCGFIMTQDSRFKEEELLELTVQPGFSITTGFDYTIPASGPIVLRSRDYTMQRGTGRGGAISKALA